MVFLRAASCGFVDGFLIYARCKIEKRFISVSIAHSLV
jgi:hypothetical protein